MDTRILKHYETELAYLREMGAEFANAYPKIAARLGMDELEVLDPYVERLLEGSAFLSARVQLELELQYPQFTNNLLEVVYPHYLPPIPSMMIAELAPDMENGAIAEGFTFKRGTSLRSQQIEETNAACTFVTANDLTIWPIEITEAQYIDGRGELVASGIATHPSATAAIRLRLARHGGQPLGELPLQALRIFLGGQGASGWELLELFGTQTLGLVARSTDRRRDWSVPLQGTMEPCGFDPEEALLPRPQQSFDGYRLVQEFFALPQRFHFVQMSGLQAGIARAEGSEMDVYVLLKAGAKGMEAGITPEVFTLNCVPCINLFERLCDRVHIRPQDVEHHIVADRTGPMNYEVHSILSVKGIGSDAEEQSAFDPFFSTRNLSGGGLGGAYYTIKRKARQRTQRERLKGARTTYLGSEAFISLIDSNAVPYSTELEQLSIRAMVSNRDLPLLLASGVPDTFHLSDGGPVAGIRTPVSPTRPRPSLAQGDSAWRLISHLSLNYLSISDGEKGDAAQALREMLSLYAPLTERGVEKQLEGIISVASRPIVRRMSDEILTTAVRGLEITLTCDEDYFEGSSVYLLGAVLEAFFRKYVTLNSFVETVLVTTQRGEICRWAPKTGLGMVI